MIIIPSIANAKSYYIGYDTTIKLNENNWEVFTRYNLSEYSELEEYGMTDEYMENYFEKNNVYIDALVLYENDDYLELVITKTPNEKINYLSNIEDKYINKIAKSLKKELNADNYTIYKNEYKFIRFEHNIDERICITYYTVVNGNIINISFQKENEFLEEEYIEIENIINSIYFNVNPELKNNPAIDKMLANKIELIAKIVVSIIGVAICPIIYKMKNKKKDNNV